MDNKANIKQAHGLTHAEMEELHIRQINGEVEMTEPNNGGENIKDPYFANDYAEHMIPIHERHLYHVAMEARTFASGGAVPVRTSVPTVQIFTKEAFEFQKKTNAFSGQITHIIHNPELEKGSKKKVVKEVKDEEETVDLEAMTVPQLKEYYTGVTGEKAPSNLNKADLIDAIREAQSDKAE